MKLNLKNIIELRFVVRRGARSLDAGDSSLHTESTWREHTVRDMGFEVMIRSAAVKTHPQQDWSSICFEVWRSIPSWLLPGVICNVVWLAVLIWGHQPIVWVYDNNFQRLRSGDSIERVIRVLGQPHEVTEDYENPSARRLVYFVNPIALDRSPYLPGVRWYVRVDQNNRIISLRRRDGIC